MAKREELSLTIEQWQRLTEAAAVLRNNFPKKWGEKTVADNDQLIGRDDAGILYKTLRAYSPWLQGIGDDYRLMFGDKDDWYPIDRDEKRLHGVKHDDPKVESWKIEDQTKVYKIRLTKEALSGLVWCCIVRTHPQTPMPLSGRDPIDLWWSIAEAAGKTAAIKKYIGLSNATRTEFEDDPDPETKTLAAPETKEAR